MHNKLHPHSPGADALRLSVSWVQTPSLKYSSVIVMGVLMLIVDAPIYNRVLRLMSVCPNGGARGLCIQEWKCTLILALPADVPTPGWHAPGSEGGCLQRVPPL